jgi:hypothetical protein
MYSYNQIKEVVSEVSGGRWFTADYDINLFGVRRATGSDSFDDLLGCIFHYKGQPNIIIGPGTTDPGHAARKDPSNPKGVAVLKEGHYKSVWQLDWDGGRRKYPHLNQVGEVTVYRDNNKDTKLDLSQCPTETGFFGIEMHRENAKDLNDSTVVGRWSEGCQVWQNSAISYMAVMNACKAQKDFYAGKSWADKYSYTLLLEEWFN